MPLPPGVLFWRAFGRSGGVRGQAASPTWEFTVGKLSAPVDTSWGTILDVNGDGYADVAVGEPGSEQVNVYLGGPSGPPASPDFVLIDSSSMQVSYFGLFVASAGDVNGDGYGDFLVGAATAAYLYLGGPSGLAVSPPTTLSLPQPAQTGVRVTGIGDVNGDGYADVAVANYDSGFAYVYLGSADGLEPSPAVTLNAPETTPPAGASSSGFGHSLAGAGDINGDGYADLIVAAPNADTNGQAYVYLGSPSGLPATPAFALSESDGPGADSVSCADDVNGDGYADVVVGGYGLSGLTTGDFAGRAYLYLGGPSGPSASPTVTLVGPQTRGAFGRWVSRAGDVNGDGYADVIIGADAESDATAPGSAYVYLGTPSGLSTTPAVTLTGPDGPGGWFGRCVAGAGDVNGDGYADVVIGADAGGVVLPADAGATGAAGWGYLYLGNPYGVVSSPAVRWVGSSNSSIFGRAVASVLRQWPRFRPG